ncbi:MAG: DUF3108 domain-containing protein [Desulfobacula sp.]|nr:DUF3108 domain-containing protein [Desulfobacula sp.]
MSSKIIIIFICILLHFPIALLSVENTFQWQVGEELTYKVKWSFIRLGTLKLQVVDTLTIDNTFVYHTRMFIDSNPLLFFVNMHSVYDSYIGEDFYPHLFIADEKIDGVTYKTRYRFNYADSLIHIKMTDVKDTTHIIEKKLPLDEKVQDGMSMIFYARGNVHLKKTETLTAFFEARKGKLDINFKGKDKKIKINSINSPIETYKVFGEANFKAIAGFGGKYSGWFATDKQRPPLKAEMKVFIGNVTIELEEWKNWNLKMIKTQQPAHKLNLNSLSIPYTDNSKIKTTTY